MKVKIKTKDNFTLDAVFIKKKSSKGIIFAHGMTVGKNDEGIFVRSESKLNEKDFSTIRFDFRGHGKSSGSSTKDFTISGELIDIGTVVNFLKEKGIKWIGLVGASFGGGISALYAGANTEKINRLFLANPVLDYDKCFLNPTTSWAKSNFHNYSKRIEKNGFIEVGSRKFKVGRQLFNEMKKYNPCDELNKYKGPLLVAHGTKDTYISYQEIADCFENLQNSNRKFQTIEGAEHGLHEEPYESQVVDVIVEFFNSTIREEK